MYVGVNAREATAPSVLHVYHRHRLHSCTSDSYIDAYTLVCLLHSQTDIELGTNQTYEASITRGSDVTYTWDMGDGQQLTGSRITYKHQQSGHKTVTVTAANQVASLQATVRVNIVEKIESKFMTTGRLLNILCVKLTLYKI